MTVTTRPGKLKCLFCGSLFDADPRNARHQKYCSAVVCRKASKAASRRAWLAKPENQDYFRSPENVVRVQAWRAAHPGYWRRPGGHSAATPEVPVALQAFKDPPLLNASGIHEPYALRSIIEVESDTGLVGLGESYGDAPVLTVLEKVKDQLIGLEPFDLNGLRTRVTVTVGGIQPTGSGGAELAPGSHPGKQVANAYSAFEVAFLDLQARHLNAPLVDVLGGAVRDQIPYSAYLFFKYAEHVDSPYPADHWGEALSEQQIVGQARRMIDQYGFKSIKLKAGALDPEHEVACIKALEEAFPGRPLRIDPNGNWSLETSVRMAGLLRDNLEYYEDPTPGLEGMSELHRRTGLPLATNMVVTDFDEFRRSVALDSVQIVLADHHYWGGLRDTQALATDVRYVRYRDVDAFQFSPGHQPDGDVACGGVRTESDIRVRYALSLAGRGRGSHQRRQGSDPQRLRANHESAGRRRGTRSRAGALAARVVLVVRHSPARRCAADAALQARLEAGQAEILRAGGRCGPAPAEQIRSSRTKPHPESARR